MPGLLIPTAYRLRRAGVVPALLYALLLGLSGVAHDCAAQHFEPEQGYHAHAAADAAGTHACPACLVLAQQPAPAVAAATPVPPAEFGAARAVAAPALPAVPVAVAPARGPPAHS